MINWSLRCFLFSVLTSIAASSACAAPTGALETIKRSGVLQVCIWPDYFGISYHNPRTGRFQGVDIDLAQAFAKDLGVKLAYVETDFGRFVGDLQAGKCQIAMMGVAVIPARAQQVDFSQPYLRGDIYAVTTFDNASIKKWADLDQPGHVISVMRGTFMEPLMRNVLKHATLIVSDQPGERERDVESGRADAFITDYPYSQRMLENTDWARVLAPEKTMQLTDYAYAVPKNDLEWLGRVDQFVSAIKQDGRLKDAAKSNNLLPMLITE